MSLQPKATGTANRRKLAATTIALSINRTSSVKGRIAPTGGESSAGDGVESIATARQNVAPPPSSSSLVCCRWWQIMKRRAAFWGRYSVPKLQEYGEYQRGTSLKRVLAAIFLSPLPGILILTCVILHHPRSEQALELDDKVYSYPKCVMLACTASGTNETIWMCIAFAWRYPIPFRELLIASTWICWFIFYHYMVLREAFAARRARMMIYLPVFTAQFGLFYVFLAVAVVFARVGMLGQVLLVIFIPPLKVVIKRIVWKLGRKLDDLSTDVTVCVVEMSAAIYTSISMHYAQSGLIPVLMFIMDLIQAAVERELYVDHSMLLDGKTALTVATDLVGTLTEAKARVQRKSAAYTSMTSLIRPPPTPTVQAPEPIKASGSRSVATFTPQLKLLSLGSSKQQLNGSTRDASNGFLDFRPPPVSPSDSPMDVDGLPISRLADARLLTQLLRLLFACEMLLFVEFLEAALALTYLVVIALAWVLPGGTSLIPLIGMSSSNFEQVLVRAAINTLLEFVSFALVFWLLKRQCGLAALYHIAYVLEYYWLTIQGKLVACLLLLLNLATLQQGTDMTLKFKYDELH
ncbi:hypothetical protein Poli38472_007944 [Pythium oligandrum]|uniref:Transmembrane protein n=1 Tax=Pythium oligandrum TaxID=41045 RepID=A0A8K1CKS8_PYTOL|nr:hypothetical protein Poli38472_007944 [Pythium oligandrum]|eukprot:TMW65302.1 hypothetical protein Poli38472_007944 [Pythium oligandrum]